MTTDQNKALVRKNIELTNKHDLNDAFALFGPDFTDHELPPGMPPGIEGARQFFTMLFAAFPDTQATVEEVLAEGDRVATRLTVQGTHKGNFMGIPPTGKQVTYTVIDIWRIANGKLVEHWGLSDQMALMQQLGVLPPA